MTELTVIVEILKKLEDGVKETGNMIEIPVKRCSLFLRKAPSKEADPVRGIDSYPMRKDFKGLNKLPCVEMVSTPLNTLIMQCLDNFLKVFNSLCNSSSDFIYIFSNLHGLQKIA